MLESAFNVIKMLLIQLFNMADKCVLMGNLTLKHFILAVMIIPFLIGAVKAFFFIVTSSNTVLMQHVNDNKKSA